MVRALSAALAAPLSDADATVQSMEDASPTKWHLAHTSWFFETFILRDHVADYKMFDPSYHFLFNSYYEAEGARFSRPQRGMLTRPSLEEISTYRAHVDAEIAKAWGGFSGEILDLIILGLNHEQQHQELLLTDILNLLAQNPLAPEMWSPGADEQISEALPLTWTEGPSGLLNLGHDGQGFAFDCEGPAHKSYLAPYALANRTVTNGEWLEFINAGGYTDAVHWLSDGWAWVSRETIAAPLYWQKGDDGRWSQFTLNGLQPLNLSAPVCHISLFEADAFASWAGARLPTEAEWEAIARSHDPESGNQLEIAKAPRPLPSQSPDMKALFGDVWEWTGSAYRPYPAFAPADGAVGEYNGRFMSGQFVLKGGSAATPRGHMRASYRNFFYPHQRWQWTGLRLAKDI